MVGVDLGIPESMASWQAISAGHLLLLALSTTVFARKDVPCMKALVTNKLTQCNYPECKTTYTAPDHKTSPTKLAHQIVSKPEYYAPKK